MSISTIREQIPNPTPVAPPGVKELVGKLDVAWWFLLVVAVLVAVLAVAAKTQELRVGGTRLSAAVLAAIAGVCGVISVFLLAWGI